VIIPPQVVGAPLHDRANRPAPLPGGRPGDPWNRPSRASGGPFQPQSHGPLPGAPDNPTRFPQISAVAWLTTRRDPSYQYSIDTAGALNPLPHQPQGGSP